MLTTLRVTQRTWLYGTRLKPGIIYDCLSMLIIQQLIKGKDVFRTLSNMDDNFFRKNN